MISVIFTTSDPLTFTFSHRFHRASGRGGRNGRGSQGTGPGTAIRKEKLWDLQPEIWKYMWNTWEYVKIWILGGYDGTIMEIYGLWMSMVNLTMKNVVQN